ncbi:hypothetical protein QJQ45_027083 [Haematococcus lacustris]|nr:hypothetical protein QJQ45_027083 [Haematococcus lacustris]
MECGRRGSAAVCPKFIPRQHLLHGAIEAAEAGDYSELQQLMHVLTRPYDEQPEADAKYSAPPHLIWSDREFANCHALREGTMHQAIQSWVPRGCHPSHPSHPPIRQKMVCIPDMGCNPLGVVPVGADDASSVSAYGYITDAQPEECR